MDARYQERSQVDSQLAKVRFFPGSQAEYETFVGYKVKILDRGDRDIGVTFVRDVSPLYRCFDSFEQKQVLVAQGIEAIINCTYVCNIWNDNSKRREIRYGLPVARAE